MTETDRIMPTLERDTTSRLRSNLTKRMEAVLAVIPLDGSLINQPDIYRALGYANGVGAMLYALERRGLIGEYSVHGQTMWRRSRSSLPAASNRN